MKRYVLLENKKIVDLKNDGYIKNINGEIISIRFRGERSNVKLQSDNLIDLLEVGDMVEEESGNIIFINEFTYETLKINFIDKNSSEGIVAIWKRQGDIMRRYER